MLEKLKEQVYEANLELVHCGDLHLGQCKWYR